jgi:hypothetical protein
VLVLGIDAQRALGFKPKSLRGYSKVGLFFSLGFLNLKASHGIALCKD